MGTVKETTATCRKCRAELYPDSRFCHRCGVKLDVTQKLKARGNGQGSVYQLPNKSWMARKTIGYIVDKNGVKKRKTVSKSGFKTKKEALDYLPQLTATQKPKKPNISFIDLYRLWEPTHKAGKSTLNCYRSALNWFSDIHWLPFADIDIDDLQDCLDDCPKGKRTKENMKALCGLLYKYAIPRNYATLNMGQYLVIHADGADERSALPMDAVKKLQAVIGQVPYADYIVAQCYLGFRPSELLALDVTDYNRAERAFIGGAKTEAGRNRTVPVSPKIQPIIDRLTQGKEAGAVFCRTDGSPMPLSEYREAFYVALDAVNVDNPIIGEGDNKRHLYTPHSCRHTFATMLKNVDAPDKDKLKIIGHTSVEMLQHYQDVDISSLRKIADAL